MEEGILFSIDGSNWFLSSFEKFTCAHFFPPLISFMTLIIFSASISRSVEPLKMFERHRKSDSYIYFCINFKWPFVFLSLAVLQLTCVCVWTRDGCSWCCFLCRSSLSSASFWHNRGNFTSTIRFYGHCTCFIVVHLFWLLSSFYWFGKRRYVATVCLVIFLMHFGHWYDCCLYWKIYSVTLGTNDTNARKHRKHKGNDFYTFIE